jgi:hypothetical protein
MVACLARILNDCPELKAALSPLEFHLAHEITLHWQVDVFERSFAEVLECEVGLASDLIESAARQIDTAGFAFTFNARGDVDSIAKDVVAIDDDVPISMPMRKRSLVR